ncbi:unnamed protein product [Anisakis simplex]|uniref:Inner membrane protein n=1 Tax=Anisakis simplex TaxID=6269 RepID=A0A0M3JV52_ANISI|nr:unnamed protein product [Anisakis simplex]
MDINSQRMVRPSQAIRPSPSAASRQTFARPSSAPKPSVAFIASQNRRNTHLHIAAKDRKISKAYQTTKKGILHLTTPKRHYSTTRKDSLRQYKISVIDQAYIARQKDTPSSVTTVFTVAGLFVVSITVLISGTIILCQHQGYAFDIFGYGFVIFGLTTLCLCAFLQRKNLMKLINEWTKDVYSNYMNK